MQGPLTTHRKKSRGFWKIEISRFWPQTHKGPVRQCGSCLQQAARLIQVEGKENRQVTSSRQLL